jgi:hypothetical protein
MPPRRPSTFRRDLLLIAFALAIAWGGPRSVRIYRAFQWTRYHVAQVPDAAGQHAREAGRWASTALRESAPLPWGSAAGRMALDYGQRVEDAGSPAAALALYESLRSTLTALRQSRWRGLGLGGLLDQVESRAQSLGGTKGPARAPSEAGTPRP